ncbi:MAG: DUF4263 domain-containing protein [Symploca sp. SIO1C2]|nr:DUF4263 domain-containing protein [Symploca sp. SIO1C2]
MLLKDKLIDSLEQAKGEREIHSFLKEEPFLVWHTFMRSGGHSSYVIPEFSFAGKYRADFAVMQSFSGGWNIAFVELEPVDEKPFNQDGSPSPRLRSAIKQIDDWKNFVSDEKASLCSHLAGAARNNDTLYPERNLAREPSCVKMPLRDPKTYLCCEYFIVMGRRSHLEDERLTYAKSRYYANHDIRIFTYDHFIEVAEKLNKSNEKYKSRTIEKQDQDFLVEFDKNPEQFSISSSLDAYNYPRDLNIYGTCYKIQSNSKESGFVVEILGTPYEIYEDRLKFDINRIEPDGLALPVANNLTSLRAAIELAEIFERLIKFHVNAEQSLDLINECLQRLIKNPPYRVVDKIDE